MAEGRTVAGILEVATREAAEIVWARKLAVEALLHPSTGVLIAFERAHASSVGRLCGLAFGLELVKPAAGKAEHIRDETLADIAVLAWSPALTASVADATTLGRLAAIPGDLAWTQAARILAS